MSEIYKRWPGSVVVKGIRTGPDGAPIVPVIASKSSPDHVKDRILSWDLSGFKGAVGAFHDRQWNWGKAQDTSFDGESLRSDVRFPTPGSFPPADWLVSLLKQDIMGDVSVIFAPAEDSKFTKLNNLGGIDFENARLFKFDFVDIGCHSDTMVQRMKQAGLPDEAFAYMTELTDRTKIADAIKVASDMTKNFSVIEATVASVTARLDDVIKRVTTLESPTAAPDTPAPGAEEPNIPDWLKSKQ